MLDERKKEPQAKIISVKKDKNGEVVLYIEYSFYHLRGGGYFVPMNYGYQEGMKKERERIIRELKKQLKEETLGDGKSVSDVGMGLEIALRIVGGEENE